VNELSLWVALIACLITCFVSTCAISLRTFSRTRLAEMLERRGRPLRLDSLTQRASELSLLTGMLRTAFNFVVLLAMLRYFERYETSWSLGGVYIAAFTSAGAMVTVFSVAIPVSWARYQAERILAWSIPLLLVFMRVLMPLIAILHLFDPIVRRISGADMHKGDDNHVSEEIMSVVEEHESEGAVDESQREMIEAVFEFAQTTAGEIMTPRTEIVGIAYGLSLNEIREKVIDAGHSRIPVYESDVDNIMGILYVKDLIRFLNQPDADDIDLKNVVREAFMVPQTKPLRELLSEFKSKKVHIAIVLDEYGGTAGLITIEDIIEELIGDIQDEYEPAEEESTIRRIDERTWEVDARVYIDDINDAMSVALPDDEDYETVGGFVFSSLGHIPEVGESFDFENLKLTVLGAERTRVTSVRIEMNEAAGKNSQE